jgi:hypothetical protein
MAIPDLIKPNQFTLHGPNIDVVYTTNGFEGKPTCGHLPNCCGNTTKVEFSGNGEP